MPIYEYLCIDCDRHFDEVRSIANRKTAICPACGRVSEQVPTKSTFHLHGPGWARDDYTGDPCRVRDPGGTTTTFAEIDAEKEKQS